MQGIGNQLPCPYVFALIRMLASLAATASTSSKSSRIFLLLPMMLEKEY